MTPAHNSIGLKLGHGWLRAFSAWIILVLSLVGTVGAWRVVHNAHAEIGVRIAEMTGSSQPLQAGSDGAWIVLVAGASVSLLLFWLALTLSKSRREVSALADRMSTSMQQNDARLFSIIQSAMEVIITIDEKQSIIIFNPMAEKVFRCAASDAIGTSLSRFIPERFRAAHGTHVSRFGDTGVSERQMGKQLALFGLRADGEEFPIEASISQIHDARGKLYTVMLRDITERQKANAALQASRNELRQLSANIQSAREEEKTHIARELHDDLGQCLTALKMDLSLLESALPRGVDSPVSARIKAMHGLIDSTVMSVRRISADLRPVMLDDLGLVSAIEWLVHDFSARYGIAAKSTLEQGDLGFDSTSATALFRMAQEALTNVARHAEATEVHVSLKREGDECVMHIRDNGKGMSGEAQGKPKSFGLLGMRERAGLMGGKVEIKSVLNQGTTVTISVPIPISTLEKA